MSKKLLKFITGNEGKAREFSQILGEEYEFELVDIDLPEIQGTPIEIIESKVDAAKNVVDGPFIVEDSSLDFEAWSNGEICLPGPYVKWYLKTVGNKGMIKMLGGYDNKNATAGCYIGLYLNGETNVFSGLIPGKISDTERGENGFGWDKIFIPHGYDITFGEFDPGEKNKISHRCQAINKLKNYLNKPGDSLS